MEEKENSIFALIVVSTVLFIFIWNFLLLPAILENVQASREVEARCTEFCSSHLGSHSYEIVRDQEHKLTHCHCRDNEGVMIGKTSYMR
jgi:hypothetical protein